LSTTQKMAPPPSQALSGRIAVASMSSSWLLLSE
jgi:hypothetical protein